MFEKEQHDYIKLSVLITEIYGPCVVNCVTYNLCVVSTIEALSKDCYYKQVDDEGHKQSNGRLDKEVFVGLTHFVTFSTVYVT